MIDNTNLIEIYYIADEFCKEFQKNIDGYILAKDNNKNVSSNK